MPPNVIALFVAATFASLSPPSAFPSGPRAPIDAAALDDARRNAAAGIATAKYTMGLAYYFGEAVAADLSRALQLFAAAAAAGHPLAGLSAGHMLEHGEGTTRDLTAAYAYYRQSYLAAQDPEAGVRAAALLYAGSVSAGVSSWSQAITTAKQMLESVLLSGHPRAYFLLGNIDEYGGSEDAPADFSRAAALYTAGCWDKGSADCCYHLGLLHAHGRGVVQDWSESARAFKHAADALGHGASAYYLGLQFVHGQGVPVDYAVAQVYLSRAAASDDGRVAPLAVEALAGLGHASSLADGAALAALSELSRAASISADGFAFEVEDEQ